MMVMMVGGRRPLPPLMGDRSDPPPSRITHVDRFPPVMSQQYELLKKVQLWRIGGRTQAFQRAIDEVHTLAPKSPKGWPKKLTFFFGIKGNFS